MTRTTKKIARRPHNAIAEHTVETITPIVARIFANHGSLRDAAYFIGCSHETIRKWRKLGRAWNSGDHENGDERYAAFALECDKARATGKMRLLAACEKKDPKWLLQVIYGASGDKIEVDAKGQLAAELLMKALHSAPDERDERETSSGVPVRALTVSTTTNEPAHAPLRVAANR